MRGQDQRFAVQQPGQCQIVGEEIDGVDMDDVVQQLEDEGVDKFEKSWHELLEATQGQLDDKK